MVEENEILQLVKKRVPVYLRWSGKRSDDVSRPPRRKTPMAIEASQQGRQAVRGSSSAGIQNIRGMKEP